MIRRALRKEFSWDVGVKEMLSCYERTIGKGDTK